MTIDEYGAVGGVRINRGERSTRRKPAPVLLCAPQIPNELRLKYDRYGRNSATNRPSCGTDSSLFIQQFHDRFEKLVSKHVKEFYVVILSRRNEILCKATEGH
jgi:hypothetical protein